MDVVVILDYASSVYRSLCIHTVNSSLVVSLKSSKFTSVVHFPIALASLCIGRARGCGIVNGILRDDVRQFALSF